jgi:membrane protein
MRAAWRLLKETVLAFVADGAASRGAAIAYYTATSLAPVLIIVIAIAGVAFGQQAARGEVASQISGLMGKEAADVLQSALKSASNAKTGSIAGVLGFLTLLVTASGVFGEMQSALNTMWKAHPEGGTVSRLVRARAASLGLVAALGFLLLTSLVVSAAISALGQELQSVLPFGKAIARLLNTGISLVLIALLFAAIYKALPDRHLTWRDVAVGAGVTSVLFTIGKFLIGLYLGSSSMASSYGAAGGLIVLLAWIYYSSQILLLGAEFTKVYASNYGSLRQTDVAASVEAASGEPLGPEPAATPRNAKVAPAEVAQLRSRLEKARSG